MRRNLARSGRAAIPAIAAIVIGLQASVAQAQTLGTPDGSGDQLIFIYDARTDRVPFLSVANPGNSAVTVEVAFYPENLSGRLGDATLTIASAGNEVIDPTQFAGGVAGGNAGLAVVTPVVSDGDRTPIVPEEPLVGGFTLANAALGSGFGQNPFGRLALSAAGTRPNAGTTVDGGSVAYERFAPDVLMVPAYFNPQTLESPEMDGNRVMLATFGDSYGTPFNVVGRTDTVTASFFGPGGLAITTQTVPVDGVLLSNLQELAGGATLSSSGKLFLDVEAGDGNYFGLYSQSLGTFASGQRLPSVASVPAGFNAGPTLDCPGGTATISANITSSVVWPSSCEIMLDGTIFVDSGSTVTIEAGTTIKGMSFPNNPPPSALVFRQGARINAQGTRDNPIVFTSDQPAGSRAAGDWAGLALNGFAPVNAPGGVGNAEGLVNTVFGGNDPNDSSGTIRYVRVEYAGRELTTDNELNVFTMNGLGAGTTIEFVQAHMGLDDGQEWFGGTVSGRYLIATGAADDLFDWQLGYTGSNQWFYGAFFGGNIDPDGSRGFEGDNNEDGFDFSPRSDPKFCNGTLIGAKGQPGGDVSNRGVVMRRGTTSQMGQMIVTQFNTAGIQIRDEATMSQACNGDGSPTGAIEVNDSIFFDVGSDGQTFAQNHSSTETAVCQTTDLFAAWQANNGVTTNDPGLPGDCSSFGCTPVPTGDVSSDFNCSSITPFFQDTNYVGAFAPGQPAWASGNWVSFATN